MLVFAYSLNKLLLILLQNYGTIGNSNNFHSILYKMIHTDFEDITFNFFCVPNVIYIKNDALVVRQRKSIVFHSKQIYFPKTVLPQRARVADMGLYVEHLMRHSECLNWVD